MSLECPGVDTVIIQNVGESGYLLHVEGSTVVRVECRPGGE